MENHHHWLDHLKWQIIYVDIDFFLFGLTQFENKLRKIVYMIFHRLDFQKLISISCLTFSFEFLIIFVFMFIKMANNLCREIDFFPFELTQFKSKLRKIVFYDDLSLAWFSKINIYVEHFVCNFDYMYIFLWFSISLNVYTNSSIYIYTIRRTI